MKFTMKRIEELVCPPGKRDVLVFDDEQKGLAVRVTSGGGKSYLVQYRFAGANRRIPLGAFSAISLAKAREACRAVLGDVAQGRDPATERKEVAEQAKRKAEEDVFTLAALIEQWQRLHLAGKRASYAAEAPRALRRAFANHLDTPATALDRALVVRVLDALAGAGKNARSGGPAIASRVAAYGRACFQWAVKRGALDSNAFESLPVPSVVKRDRVLTDAELVAIWDATNGAAPFNAIVRALILTGQRREEVAGMRRDELSPDGLTWIIPASRAKNGAAHLVPLSKQARAVVEASPRGESPLVIAGQKGPFSGFSKAKISLDKASGVEGWRLHDLRRTMATGLQRLGVRLEVTESVLNHVSGTRGGIAGVYQRHDWAEEKRAALDAWGEHVAAIVERRKPTGNVVAIGARR